MPAVNPIYLDHHATTPLDARVLEAMLPYFKEFFGNAASNEHAFGWAAEAAVKLAREEIAEHLGAKHPSEIIFTSGATESNNLAILGTARRYARKGKHLISVVTEHKSVLDCITAHQKEGGTATLLKVAADGLIDLNDLQRAIQPDTVLISVMAANHEIGTLQPLHQIGEIAHQHGILFHSDATQAIGKIPLDLSNLPVDLLSLSAHKVYGPKGVGALYVRRKKPRINLTPILHGGGHERGMRSGTLNVPGIVGLAKAISLAMDNIQDEAARLLALRNHLWHGIKSSFPTVTINGNETKRLAGNLNVCFAPIASADILSSIYAKIALSSGSACTSANPEPSNVILALGGGEERTLSSLRFGLGRGTTLAEIETTLTALRKVPALQSLLTNH